MCQHLRVLTLSRLNCITQSWDVPLNGLGNMCQHLWVFTLSRLNCIKMPYPSTSNSEVLHAHRLKNVGSAPFPVADPPPALSPESFISQSCSTLISGSPSAFSYTFSPAPRNVILLLCNSTWLFVSPEVAVCLPHVNLQHSSYASLMLSFTRVRQVRLSLGTMYFFLFFVILCWPPGLVTLCSHWPFELLTFSLGLYNSSCTSCIM